MARERMVTRTVSGYNVDALCVDIQSESTFRDVYKMGAEFNPEKALESMRTALENDWTGTAVAHVYRYWKWEELRGMSEQDFMYFGEELPPRGESNGRGRERMVTRTIKGYNVQCLMIDITTQKMTYPIFEMGADFNPAKGLESIRASKETEELKIVSILATEEFERLYGMTEKRFIDYSEVLPPRGNTTEE